MPVRDDHLRSPEFLDADRHPVIGFRGHRVHRTGDGWAMDGDLTVAGVTRPLTLTGQFLGQDVYPFTGGRRLGFTGRATVDRRGFGVSGLPPLPAPRSPDPRRRGRRHRTGHQHDRPRHPALQPAAPRTPPGSLSSAGRARHRGAPDTPAATRTHPRPIPSGGIR
ncbi:YceI family protein [Streptomyces uncialis]|uniref:YceI family protein n=1 Tax=Streptomyces uncialis TaxID=1048205 RepID=UPI0037891F48